ncbi:DUF924 family protein [Aquamicrobium defluvii]|uniref:DUF924 family protein n=1 Tax=Aquamicrobium defluvii TaxID=69279 RepID=UPI000A0474FD|nr:DUF924 family protein [Aquamicrobium defluvii]
MTSPPDPIRCLCWRSRHPNFNTARDGTKVVHGLPLGHCEGPDHLQRLDLLIGLREEIAAEAPTHLQPIYRSLVKQALDVKQVIAAFGRHPHRNQVLGRRSSRAEVAYLKEGDFPHERAFQG